MIGELTRDYVSLSRRDARWRLLSERYRPREPAERFIVAFLPQDVADGRIAGLSDLPHGHVRRDAHATLPPLHALVTHAYQRRQVRARQPHGLPSKPDPRPVLPRQADASVHRRLTITPTSV
jgi:hypothetical protein